MDRTFRSILWMLVGLVLLSSFSAGWFFVLKERIYDEYVKLEFLFKSNIERLGREQAVLKKENIELSSKLETVKKEMDLLEKRNKDIASKYEELLGEKDGLSRELARIKKGKFFLEKRVKEIESEEFIACLLKEKGVIEEELERLKSLLAPRDLEIQKEIERLKAQNMDLDVKLSKVQEEKGLLEQKLKSSTDTVEMLSKDLSRRRELSQKAKQKYEDIKIENEQLKTRLASLGRKGEDTVEELRAEAYHGPKEVELPPIILEVKDNVATGFTRLPLDRIGTKRTLKGRIVTVNREHNFVVIDLGTLDEVSVGTRFDVYRAGDVVGHIEVIQTRERISAADIKDVERPSRIEIDDVIIRQ